MINLVIDNGNTRFKFAIFEKNELIFSGCSREELAGYLKQTDHKDIAILYSGSGKTDLREIDALKSCSSFFILAGPDLMLPLTIDYATPQTLGFDRVASCCGAWSFFPGSPILVIDAGTAITFDYISPNGIFQGGNISPGYAMRFKSLHAFTDKLPLENPMQDYLPVGKDTKNAVVSGVMHGILLEINGYTSDFLSSFPQGKIVITGGDAPYFLEKILKKDLYNKNLGLLGLNTILDFNKIR